MGKSRAEIQKAYRERRKKESQEFLEKERKRAQNYRVPIVSLSDEANENRKLKNRIYNRRYNSKKQEETKAQKRAQAKLVVHLAYSKRPVNKRRSKAIRIARSENEKIKNEAWKWKKRCQRLQNEKQVEKSMESDAASTSIFIDKDKLKVADCLIDALKDTRKKIKERESRW